jgi:hypothetical protein
MNIHNLRIADQDSLERSLKCELRRGAESQGDLLIRCPCCGSDSQEQDNVKDGRTKQLEHYRYSQGQLENEFQSQS